MEYKIGSIPLKGEPHKMFTLCTSTAFAGCDFYSTCATTFVISDNRKVHTAIDIATELVQIAGRQRLESNLFRKAIFFIYNVDIGEMDKSVYKNEIKKRLTDSIETADFLNGSKGGVRENLKNQTIETQRLHKYSESYVRYDEITDSFIVNEWTYQNDLFAYEVQHENYVDRVTVRRQLNDSGFDTSENEIISHYKEQVECILVKEGFAERMKRYCEYRRTKENCSFVIPDDLMERQYPELRIYYDGIGYDRIKALGYKEKALKNEI